MQKKLFRLAIACSISIVSLTAATAARAEIIETNDGSDERLEPVSSQKGGENCQRFQVVDSPQRASGKANMHQVDRCGERVEIAGKKTEIGKTYWYGWSVFIPDRWNDSDPGSDLLNQWATYPTNNKNFSQACRANGSYLARGRGDSKEGGGNSIDFVLQRAGDSSTIECNKFPLATVSQLKGKWTDFVMNVKWTGNKDGFLNLWMKIGDDSYIQKINYQGPTFWNDEGTGPYFKMGLYKGDPNFEGPAPRTVYTDEYRLGDERSSFQEVAPPGKSETQEQSANSNNPNPDSVLTGFEIQTSFDGSNSSNSNPPGTNESLNTDSASSNSARVPSESNFQDAAQVTLYQHQNFGGKSQAFSLGKHDAERGQFETVGNNSISSLRVPQGLIAELCDTQKQNCQSYQSGNYSYVGDKFNDRASFLEVQSAK